MLHEKMVDSIQATITNYFQCEDVEFFLGGSRRFEYQHNFSDVDFHCFVEKEKENEFSSYLFHNGFRLDMTKKTEEYPAIPFHFHHLVHIVIHNDRQIYDQLRTDHQRLHKHIIENPVLKSVAKSMKMYGLRGSRIYRILLHSIDIKD
jgi:hypothetical protein